MMFPEIIHRKLEVLQPLALGVVSASGSGLSLVLAQAATTPAEYGAIFLAFLVFLGLGVLSIAGYAAHKIVSTAIDAFTAFAGDQAKKLEGLPTAAALDERLKNESDRRDTAEAAIAKTLKTIEASIGELTTVNRLMAQKLEGHEKRLDRQEALQGK